MRIVTPLSVLSLCSLAALCGAAHGLQVPVDVPRAAPSAGSTGALSPGSAASPTRSTSSTQPDATTRNATPPSAAVADPDDAARATRDMARALERRLPPDRPEARVPLADWMWRKGMHTDALLQLDRVLEVDPDQRNALALLAQWDGAIAVLGARSRQEIPAETRARPGEYLQQAASLPAAARELALTRIIAVADADALQAAARAALVARDDELRVTAARVLRRAAPGSALAALIDRAVLDRSVNVRAEAARTLIAAHEPDVVAPLARVLVSRHDALRANAAEVLGTLGFASAVEPLVHALAAHPTAAASAAGPGPTPNGVIFTGRQTAYIRDYDVEIAQGASIADPIIDVLQDGAVLDARLLGISQSSVQVPVSTVMCAALAKLTRQPLGSDPAAWIAWWNAHGASWSAAQSAPADAERAASNSAPSTGSRAYTSDATRERS